MSSYETILSIWHKTLLYSNIFDYPLTKDELYEFALTDRPVTQEEFERWFTKNKPLLDRTYSNNEEYWAIAGRDALFPVREERNTVSKKKLRTARLATLPLFLMPWVQLIAVTGTTAAGNARDKDDVDLYIVTSPKRTWLTRFIMLSYFSLIGRRYHPRGQNKRTTFCVNHIVDMHNLDDPHHDLYIANEIVRMHVLWERNSMFGQLLAANSWVATFVPHWYEKKKEVTGREGVSLQAQSNPVLYAAYFIVSAPIKTPLILVSWALDGMEDVTRRIQEKRMQQRIPTSDEKDLLTVHQRDNRQWILREFQEIV